MLCRPCRDQNHGGCEHPPTCPCQHRAVPLDRTEPRQSLPAGILLSLNDQGRAVVWANR